MKKYLGLFIFLLVLLSYTSAYANDEDRDVSIKTNANLRIEQEDKLEIKNETKAQIEDVRAEAKVKIEALKAKLEGTKDVKAKLALKKIVDSRVKVFDGFNRVLENVTKTEEKVKIQITKAKSLNIDVTVAEANILKVDAKLAEAKLKIKESADLFTNSTTKLTEDQKTKLRELATAIQNDFKEARLILNNTVKSLRGSIQTYKTNLTVKTNTSAEGETRETDR